MSSSEAWLELGRLREQVKHMGETVQTLQGEKEVLDAANEAMHEEMATVKSRLRVSERERSSLKAEVRRLNEEMEEQSEELEKAKDHLAKAQRTIKVQSDQIAAPNPRKPWTPQGPAAPPPAIPSTTTFGPPPPTFVLPQRQGPPPRPSFPPSTSRQPSSTSPRRGPVAGYDQPHASGGYEHGTAQRHRQRQGAPPPPSFPSSTSRQPSSTSPRRGPVAGYDQPHASGGYEYGMAPSYGQRQALGPGYPHQPTSGDARRGSVGGYDHPPATDYRAYPPARQFPVTPTRQGSHGSSWHREGTLVRQRQNEVSDINLRQQLTPLFEGVRDFCLLYANVPDQARDLAMPPSLHDHIQRHTSYSQAVRLLSSSSTRHMTVAKIINVELINHCFKPSVTLGFHRTFDERMHSFRSQAAGQTPQHLRRGLLVAAADLVEEMCQTPGYDQWMEAVKIQKARETFDLIRPLLARDIDEGDAWSEMQHLWREGLRVGFLMVRKASIFHITFPTPGPESPFNPGCMACKDAKYARVPPPELGKMGLRVRLAVTPVVTETDFSGAGVLPMTLCYADVSLEEAD